MKIDMSHKWKKCLLKEVGKIVGGGTPPTKDLQNYENGNIPWITPKDLSNFDKRFIKRGERNITEYGLQNSSAKMLPKNTVLFSSRAPIGYIAIAENELCTNQGFKSIVPNKSIDYLFLYYLLQFKTSEIVSLANGSTFKEISGTNLGNLKIKIPESIEIQEKIASILSALDEKIELNNEINNNLMKIIKFISTAFFYNFSAFNYEIPQKWNTVNLKDIAIFENGYSYKGSELKNSKTALATIKNFNRTGGFKIEGYKEIVPQKSKLKHEVDLFDILVAHTDLTQNADIIGNAELLLSKDKYSKIIFSMDLVKVIPKNNFISKYLLGCLLQNINFKKHCLGYTAGTTVLHLNKKALYEYTVILPDNMKELQFIDNLLKSYYQIIADNLKQTNILKNIKKLILPKLLSGEIDISNIELGELLQ